MEVRKSSGYAQIVWMAVVVVGALVGGTPTAILMAAITLCIVSLQLSFRGNELRRIAALMETGRETTLNRPRLPDDGE